jgi:hypothetical protein
MKKFISLVCLASTIIGQSPNYNFEYYAMSENHGSFELPQQTKNIAYNAYRLLGLSKFFDTSKITDSVWVNKEFQKDSTHSEFTTTTQDGHQVKSSFFNRNKDKLIVVGPGFTNPKETMAPFAHMFLDYDVIIVNFRGLGIKDSFTLSPLYHLLGIDCKTQVGHSEHNDIFAAVDWARKNKEYKSITGLGVCLGAFVCAKAQGIAEEQGIHLFDKVIVDGCWLTANKAKDKIIEDPWLIMDPQRGGASKFTKNFFKKKFVHQNLLKFIEYSLGVNASSLEIQPHLKNIKKTPILIFYGKDDLMIYRDEFEDIWNNISTTEKAAIITSNPHVYNHLRSKELYKLICESFIEEGIQKTFDLLQNPNDLDAQLKNKSYTDAYVDILKPRKAKKEKSNTTRNLIVALLAATTAYKLRKTS